MIPQDYVGPYLASNIIALGLLLTAWAWPRFTRYAFAVVFFAASVANILAVLRDPESYVTGYGELATGFYQPFIYGFFSENTLLIVLAIALGQFLIGLFLSVGGRLFDFGVIGAGVFFLAITPLGLGSAFPCTLVLAVALGVMVWRLKGKGISVGSRLPNTLRREGSG